MAAELLYDSISESSRAFAALSKQEKILKANGWMNGTPTPNGTPNGKAKANGHRKNGSIRKR
jgi:hypothetical protein